MNEATRKRIASDPNLLVQRFIHLRQHGHNRDDAWFQVLREVGGVADHIQSEFLKLAKMFERREGYQYRYADQAGSGRHTTLSRQEMEQRSTDAERQQLQAARQQYRDNNGGLTGNLNPTHLRENRATQLNQVLDQLDHIPGNSNGIGQPTPQLNNRPAVREGTAPIHTIRDPEFFGLNTRLLMYFVGYSQPLVINIAGEDELYIGRATGNSAMAPEIDLNRVNGGDFGVSRMHAAITRRNDKLLIVDLGSVNHTRVNGVRLLQNEIYSLKDGDEIWFGQLRCKIRFKYE